MMDGNDNIKCCEGQEIVVRLGTRKYEVIEC
jgi:hypothetical protein